MMNTFTISQRAVMAMVFLLMLGQLPAVCRADYSTVIEVENQACMGDDKTRRQTEQEALQNVKRAAAEHARTFVTSETTVQDMVLEKDLIEAFAQATVKILEELEKAWFRDQRAGDCFRVRVRAEVIPHLDDRPTSRPMPLNNPDGPLQVRLWTSQEVYHTNDTMRIFLQGNKPFYAVIHYHDAHGGVLQLLPNPFRQAAYFNGGTVYEIPSGKDDFELVVGPPFGTETLVVYAATAPLGPLHLKNLGPVFEIQDRKADIPDRMRGLRIQKKSPSAAGGPPVVAAAEFVEQQHQVITRP